MIEKGLERRPRDILVRKRPDGKRPGYGRWDDPGMSPGTSHDHGRDSSNDPGPAHLSHNAPAPAPVDYSSLDNEEQQAVDRGEPTAQMTPTERNEQGHGPGGTNNPDYKQKQYEITGDIDELSDFTGIDTRPKIDIADIHGETDDPSSVSYDPTYNPAYQARQTRQAIAEYSPSFFDSGIGKALKTAGKIITQPLLPEPIQRALTGLNLARTGTRFAKAVTGKDIKQIPSNQALINKAVQNLTKKREPNILDEFGYKGNVYAKKPTVQRDDGNRDDLAKVVSGQQDVVSKAVNQFRGTKVEDQISSLVTNNLNRALQFYAQMTPMIEAGKASRQEMDAYELLGFYLNKQNQAMRGGSTYI